MTSGSRSHVRSRPTILVLLVLLMAIAMRPAFGFAQAEDKPLLTAADYALFATEEPDHVYAYGADSQQFAELYLPDAPGPYAVIVMIHGGCYYARYDLRPISGAARSLAAEGFAVWNIEYRRYGNGGEFPAMFLDVGAAADYLREIAEKHALLLDSVIAMGHSAGGHLALWLASRPGLEENDSLYSPEPLPIAGIIGLASIADIGDAMERGICGEALPIVAGSQQANLRQVSPEQLLPKDIPQIHMLGSQDELIDANLKRYVEAAGDEAELLILEGAGHFELVAIDAPEWEAVVDALQRLRTTIGDALR